MAWKNIKQRSLNDRMLIQHKALTELDDILKMIKWQSIEKHLVDLHISKKGERAYPPLMMFKPLLLQSWYNLSDQQLESQLARDLLFRRFVGIGLDDSVPDHSSVWRFRQKISEEGRLEYLLDRLNQGLTVHGIFFLISAIIVTKCQNMIPLVSLASILIIVGYKLAKPALFKQMYQLGYEQFIPFIVTILAIVFTDLLKGIVAGLIVGIFFTLYHRYRDSHYIKDTVSNEDGKLVHHMVLSEHVSFFNKANIVQALEKIPKNSKVVIDASMTKVLDHDVKEVIHDYLLHAKLKEIEVQTIGDIINQ